MWQLVLLWKAAIHFNGSAHIIKGNREKKTVKKIHVLYCCGSVEVLVLFCEATTADKRLPSRKCVVLWICQYYLHEKTTLCFSLRASEVF